MAKETIRTREEWARLHQEAADLFRANVSVADVVEKLGVPRVTVSKWKSILSKGRKIRIAAGRPRDDDHAIKQALIRAFNGKRYFHCDAPLNHKIPFLPPVSHSAVKVRLEEFGIYKSENTIRYWLKRLGWTPGLVPKEFIVRYVEYIESRCADDIEDIVRNRSRVSACLLQMPSGNSIPRLRFELLPVRWEDWSSEELREMSEFEREHTRFLSHPCPDDPWQGETLTGTDIADIRKYLISEATENCIRLFAELFHYCQNQALLDGEPYWSDQGETLPIEMDMGTSSSKVPKRKN